MTDESITVGDTTVFLAEAAHTADELIEHYGFHPAQIIQNAHRTDVWPVVDVIRDAWYQAMWTARTMSREQIEAWLAADPHDRDQP
jgi:hypothetical protein